MRITEQTWIRWNRAISVGLGTAFLLLLGCIGTEEELMAAQSCTITYPDLVGDTRSCAAELVDYINKDRLNWPNDEDWYYFTPKYAVYGLMFWALAPNSAIRCSVYTSEGTTPLTVAVAGPGQYCNVQVLNRNRYYLRIRIFGPYLPGTYKQNIPVVFFY